jgi:predicted DNA-binding WGR domain protein
MTLHEAGSAPLNLELRQIDPARSRARRYHVTEARSLFGEHALLIAWGRIGRPARVRLEAFSDEHALAARLRELLVRRDSHGYCAMPVGDTTERKGRPSRQRRKEAPKRRSD